MAKLSHGMGKKTGLPPGSLVYTGARRAEMVSLTVLDYDADHYAEAAPNTVADLLQFKDSPAVTWIHVDGLHDTAVIEQIGTCFGIHPLVLEDILEANHRPKLEDYGDYLYLVTRIFPAFSQADPATEQLSLILGPTYVLTFQEHGHPLFDALRQRLQEGKGRLRSAGADYLFYALLDTVVDNYFTVLETLGENIENLEDELVAQPNRDTLQDIHRLKRQLLVLRKALWPMREVMGTLSRGESPLIRESTHLYLRDVYDHTIQVLDTLETYRDILSGMLDIYLSSISNHMNQIMKVLTIISTLFIPLTFIVGLYGMNFKYMPELEWEWGYPAVWLVMLVIIIGMLNFFRRRNWI